MLFEEKHRRNQEDQNLGESIPLHCSPVSIYDYVAIGTNEVESRLIENTKETKRNLGPLDEIKQREVSVIQAMFCKSSVNTPSLPSLRV